MLTLHPYPNQAEVKNVETSYVYLGAWYMILIKLKPSETYGMRNNFLILTQFCVFKIICHLPWFSSHSLLNTDCDHRLKDGKPSL